MYMLIDKKTNLPVWEFYNKSIIKKVNIKRYGVMASHEWLQYLNLQLKRRTIT